MKRSLQVLTLALGIWMANPFLILLYIQNRPLYDAFIASGAQLYSCVDWAANGHMIEGVCEEPMPVFHLQQ